MEGQTLLPVKRRVPGAPGTVFYLGLLTLFFLLNDPRHSTLPHNRSTPIFDRSM